MAKKKEKLPTPVPTPGSLACPRCRKAHSVETILDNCSVSWPTKHWIAFKCPKCRCHFLLAIGPRTLTIGDIDGAPGPCFIPSSRISLKNFKSNFKETETKIKYRGRTWIFVAR